MIKRSIRIKYTNILSLLYNKFDDTVKMLTTENEYLGTHYESKFECQKCGRIFKLSINKILNKKNACSECSKPKIKYYDVKNFLNKKNISILNILDLYSLDKQYKFKCLDCFYEWTAFLRNIYTGKKCCPKCTNHLHYNINYIKNELYLNHNNKIDIFEETYEKISKKAKFKCKICQNEWTTICRNVVKGETGCPKCKLSNGERKIEKFLTLNNIKFENQKTFKECRHIRLLPFDFYLPNLNTCIEFDGKQHFIPYNNINIKKFNDTLRNDNIKNIYCLNNKISLIRIKYTDIKNINNILKYKLKI